MMKLLLFLKEIAEDVLILTGAALIVGTTYSISVLAGHYLLGILCVAVGLLIAKGGSNEKQKQSK